MQTANFSHVENILWQLLSLDEKTFDRLSAMDSNDKESMRGIFLAHLGPIYGRLPPHGKSKLKHSLRYFLNVRTETPSRLLSEMQDLPLNSANPYPALEALWEAFFPGEEYKLVNVDGYIEKNDDNGNEIFAPDESRPRSP